MLNNGKFVKNRRILSGDIELVLELLFKWLPMLRDGMHFLPWQGEKIVGHCTIVVDALFILKKM